MLNRKGCSETRGLYRFAGLSIEVAIGIRKFCNRRADQLFARKLAFGDLAPARGGL